MRVIVVPSVGYARIAYHAGHNELLDSLWAVEVGVGMCCRPWRQRGSMRSTTGRVHGGHLRADTDTVPGVVATIFMECHAAYRTDGPEHLRPVTSGLAAMQRVRPEPRQSMRVNPVIAKIWMAMVTGSPANLIPMQWLKNGTTTDA